MQLAIVPIVNSVKQQILLRHPNNKIKLIVASCLSKIMRILVPVVPYDDVTMKDVLYLIADSFQDMDDISCTHYSIRVGILKIIA